MKCRTARDYLQVYLDSELETVETLAVNRHLETCASCQRRFQGEHRLETAIAAHLRAGLEDDERRFAQVLDRRRQEPPRRSRHPLRWFLVATVVLLVALVVALVSARGGGQVPALVRTAAADHVKYSAGLLAPDVSATTSEGVRAYLEPRLSIACPDLPETDGWRIVGPRLCRLDDVPVGLVLLEHDGQPVSLFLLTTEGAAQLSWSPLPEARCFPLTDGHAVVAGSTGTIRCAIGGASLPDLERLATAAAR